MNKKFTFLFGLLLGAVVMTYYGAGILQFFQSFIQKETLLKFLFQLFNILGALTFILLLLWGILRLIYGKHWWMKVGISFFAGAELKESALKVVQEGSEGKVSRDSYRELGVSVFKRLTRLGIFAVLIALIPFVLLFQQNQILGVQTELLNRQDYKLEVQNNLLGIIQSDSLFQQLKFAYSLFQCKNLDPKIEAQLKDKNTGMPCLFTKYGCPENKR